MSDVRVMGRTAAVIMAKEPAAGRTKTRLCPPLSPSDAARLYDALLHDTIALVSRLPGVRLAVAAVSGSLVQPVYEVHMTNHAGTVAFLYWDSSNCRSHFMDACAELPRELRPFTPNPYAPSSAASIPGFIPGLADMLERFGTKTWTELCEPAVKAAREGIVMTPWQYGYLHQTLAYRTYYPSGRQFFTPDGFLTASGEVWKTPTLARTLERLMVEGPEYFTKGGWAKKLVNSLVNNFPSKSPARSK